MRSPERDERVVSGEVRNRSLRPIEIAAADLEILDSDGRPLDGQAIFLEGFVHGLHPPTREPEVLPESELTRTGRVAALDPGETVALTAAWRTPETGGRAERIDYGTGSLPVP